MPLTARTSVVPVPNDLTTSRNSTIGVAMVGVITTVSFPDGTSADEGSGGGDEA